LFFCLIVLNWCTSFRDRIANLQLKKWLLRRFRCKRSINRGLQRLGQLNRVQRIGRVKWRLASLKTARPIHTGILALVVSPADCLYVRFVLYLAFYRGRDYAAITVDDIRQSMRINRNTAFKLHKWLQSRLPEISRKHLRRRVFYCTRPNWWSYTASAKMHRDFKTEKRPAGIVTKNDGQYYSVPQLAGHIINDLLNTQRELTSIGDPPTSAVSRQHQHCSGAASRDGRDKIILLRPGTNNSYESRSSMLDSTRLPCQNRTYIADSELETMSDRDAMLSGMHPELKKFFLSRKKK